MPFNRMNLAGIEIHFFIPLQNAFPVSGQLYTTHLLSLEALLTVIDSTEAHCQAKVMNSAAEQDQSETLTVEGEATFSNSTDSATGMKTWRSVHYFSIVYCLDLMSFSFHH